MLRIQDGVTETMSCIKDGQLDQAQRACERVLSHWPGHALSWHLLGVIEHERARYDHAIKYMKRALELDCTRDRLYFALGVSCCMAGRRDEAVAAYRDALKLNPRHADALNNLGSILLEQGDREGALRCFRQAVSSRKGHAGARANLGLLLAESGDANRGIHHLELAARLKPDVSAYQCALARALRGQHRLNDAVRCFQLAIKLEPDSVEAHQGLGGVRIEQGDLAQALRHYRNGLQIKATAEGYRGAGTVLMTMGRYDEAERCLEQASQRRPNDPETIAAQARLDEICGRFDRAWQRLRPLMASGWTNVSVAMVFAAVSRHLDRRGEAITILNRILEGPVRGPRQFMPLHFALGKLQDEQGRYDKAFGHFQEANRLKPRSFDPVKHQRFIDELIDTFNADAMSNLPCASVRDSRPIFIVGMPRSGTSLIEQILSCHRNVHGAGESQAVFQVAEQLPRKLGQPVGYPRCVTAMTVEDANAAARPYLAHLTKLAPDAQRVTDKLPGNFLHLGLIAILFPQAHVIHCRRDPLDTCLSCYFQNFTGDHGYAYDLEHLGGYYRQYERLMVHLEQALPILIKTVQYEELVDHPEPIIRDILDFADLPWDEACLPFHESDRRVTTASYAQVRQPIYRSSIGRWRHYESHLGPLKRALNVLFEPGDEANTR